MANADEPWALRTRPVGPVGLAPWLPEFLSCPVASLQTSLGVQRDRFRGRGASVLVSILQFDEKSDSVHSVLGKSKSPLIQTHQGNALWLGIGGQRPP